MLRICKVCTQHIKFTSSACIMITCCLEHGMTSSSRLCILPLTNTDYATTKCLTEMHTSLCVSVRERCQKHHCHDNPNDSTGICWWVYIIGRQHYLNNQTPTTWKSSIDTSCTQRNENIFLLNLVGVFLVTHDLVVTIWIGLGLKNHYGTWTGEQSMMGNIPAFSER